jgi:hypothetical protein
LGPVPAELVTPSMCELWKTIASLGEPRYFSQSRRIESRWNRLKTPSLPGSSLSCVSVLTAKPDDGIGISSW